MSEVQVSICCLVYNHEKYLRQCLDGFVMQKDVAFEVLIHDDASTDHSADIIREYEEKYPSIFKPIYQTENQYSKGVPINTTYQYPRAKGKYIAMCEGDDFWTDPLKLKRQVDAMETHPKCHACVHRVQGVDETGSRKTVSFPKYPLKSGVITSNRVAKLLNTYPFHTSSFMFYRDDIDEYRLNQPYFAKIALTGDVPMLLYFITRGSLLYLGRTMSCYRMGSVGSWSSRTKSSIQRQKQYFCNDNQVSLEFEKYCNHRFDLSGRRLYNDVTLIILENGYGAALKHLVAYRGNIPVRLFVSVFVHAALSGFKGAIQVIRHGKK